MQRIVILVILCLPAVLSLSSSVVPDVLTPVYRLRVAHDSATFFISMSLVVPKGAVSSDRELRYTPVLRYAETERELPAVSIAGRNRYYRNLRKGKGAGALPIYRADKTDTIFYHATVPYEPWMMEADLCLKDNVCGCLEKILSKDQKLVATLDFAPKAFHPQWVFRVPEIEEKRRAVRGTAFIDFPVNISKILEQFRNNRDELNKILSSIDAVEQDSDYQITSIHIKGYASPDGNFKNNERLARERTAALTAYVQQLYRFPSALLHTAYEPEDWEGFRVQVEQAQLEHRADILRLIGNSEEEPDRKEQLIKRLYPADYQQIRQSIYPLLRHSDYVIAYTVRAYTDVEEARHILKEEPGKLSPYEFYKVAESYPQGSDAYCEVFYTMATVYPTNQLANLNAANVAMSRGELATARKFLDKADSQADANYARGVLAALLRNWDEALSWFSRAGAMEEAQAAIRQVEELKLNRDRIEIE